MERTVEAMGWLLQLDERVFLGVNGTGGPVLDVLFSLITLGGYGPVLAAVVLGPMALFDRRRLRLHLLPMVLSVALGALAIEGIKSVVDRDRPARHFAEKHKGLEVRMPRVKLYGRSFPSGHAQAAFGTATYVALLYPIAALPALAMAFLVGVSRVYLGVHFPLDVLGGALVGVGGSLLGFWIRRRRSRRPRPRQPS